MSILPVYTALVLAIGLAFTLRAWRLGVVDGHEVRTVFGLLAALVVWAGISIILGLRGAHLALMQQIPFLWQAFVPMVIWMVQFTLSSRLRHALGAIAEATPAHWLILVQALRIGAIGGVVKGFEGEIRSDYVFWIGIPDFLFGLSALAVAWLAWRRLVSPGLLIVWNLLGFALIALPTFLPMAYWMDEPGFDFIFEFPMILAPSIVVSLLISLNLLQAWVVWRQISRSKAWV